ncbi:anti-sigma factor [Microbacterium schleiferi]|uniref:Regulator of SigK n=1 Tax=Microbacterium schleiferi TaxID=69362 RepID=A0A7S8MVI2_9MICO|nr:anti-sigma factor [Microbacterium schleiferi]QPE03972.1 anti-sigma factor [Microbacterium schleiferi]
MNEKEFAELSAASALGALDADQQQAFDLALAMHPEWRGIAERDLETAAALADYAPEVEPPDELRHHILTRIALTPQTDAIPVGAEPLPSTGVIQTQSRTRWMRSMFALAASLVLLVALGFTAVSLSDSLNRPDAVVALEQVQAAPDAQSAAAEFESGGGESTVYWSESVGKAVIVSDGLPQIAEDQSFELWFIRDNTPIAAGAYDPSGGDQDTWVLQGAMEPGDTIAITIEPQGGSPDGVPTGDPVVAIPT